MANYRYHVITPAGKEKKGIITASDRPHAMAVLKNDGNTVISIDAPSIWDKEFELPFLNPGVRPRDSVSLPIYIGIRKWCMSSSCLIFLSFSN